MVIGPDGQPDRHGPGERARRGEPAEAEDDDERGRAAITDLVEQPAKVMRIGSMIRQLLEEVKAAPLDEASRNRLKEIHQASIKELEAGLAPELVEELERLTLPFTEDGTPSEGELRIAQAQLVGWLEGLFHGIQTAIYAQQMAARAQLEQMRRALPPGMHAAARPRRAAAGSRGPAATAGRVRRHVPLSRSAEADRGGRQAEQAHDHQRQPGRGQPGELRRSASPRRGCGGGRGGAAGGGVGLPGTEKALDPRHRVGVDLAGRRRNWWRRTAGRHCGPERGSWSPAPAGRCRRPVVWRWGGDRSCCARPWSL